MCDSRLIHQLRPPPADPELEAPDLGYPDQGYPDVRRGAVVSISLRFIYCDGSVTALSRDFEHGMHVEHSATHDIITITLRMLLMTRTSMTTTSIIAAKTIQSWPCVSGPTVFTMGQ